MNPKYKGWVYTVLITLSSIAVYINSLSGEFIWDDIPQVLENSFIRDLKNIPSFFTVDLGRYTAYPGMSSPYYRPLFLVSYTMDYSLWGLNSFGYHISNVLLHTLSSLLVYAIALRLLKENPAAFLAGLVFAIHPVHAEVVSWIGGRADLLAAPLLFTSFYLYIAFREKGRKLLLGLSIIAYAFSLFSKEMAISLPLLLFAYEFSLRQDCNKGIINKFFYPILYIVISGIYFMLRILAMGSVVLTNPDSPPLNMGRIYATPGILLNYLRLFIFPANLKIVYDIPLKDSILDPEVLFSVLILSIILITILFTYYRNRKVFFPSLWFLITILPALGPASLVLMADRYLYIPSLGLSLLGGLFFSKIYHLSSDFRVRSLLLLPLILLFIVTFERNKIWKDEFTYFKRAVEDAPKFALHYNNLGRWYLGKKMYDEAIPLLKKAIELDPGYSYPHLVLGNVYLQKGLYEEAISENKSVLQIRPDIVAAYYRADAYCGLGNTYKEMGRMDEAIAQWQMAISIVPMHSESNNNLGNVYLLQGNYREAVERYRAALKGRPLNAEAHYNLGMALEGLGEINEARAHYQIFLELGQKEYKELVKEVEHRLKSK